MRCTLCTLILFMAACGAFADQDDDTLKYYLKKSDVVVAGVIVSGVAGRSTESGVVHYEGDFRIEEVIKGPLKVGTTIKVDIVRFEREDADRLPHVRKGGACILFLRRPIEGVLTTYPTSDNWFGAQQGSPRMVSGLKRIMDSD